MADDLSTSWSITTDPPANGGDGDECTCEEITYVTGIEIQAFGQLLVRGGDTPVTIAAGAGFVQVTGYGAASDTGGASASAGPGTIAYPNRAPVDFWVSIFGDKNTGGASDIALEVRNSAGAVLADGLGTAISHANDDRPCWSLNGRINPGPPDQVLSLHVSNIGGGDIDLTRIMFQGFESSPVLITETKQVCVCEGGECLARVNPVLVIDPSGGSTPIPVDGPGVLFPVGGVSGFILHVDMAAPFDPSLYTATALYNGAPIPDGFGPVFTTITAGPVGPPGTQTFWEMSFTTPPGGPPPASIGLRVTEIANPECTWDQPAGVTRES